jgi:hypothetical protein
MTGAELRTIRSIKVAGKVWRVREEDLEAFLRQAPQQEEDER